MTDNEIIKVFKYCLLDDEFNGCRNCSAHQDDRCTIPDLGQEILQLFDRQRAENEKLKIELQAMRNAANGYKAEIKRLKDYNENLITANTELSNEILEIKSEAIKEFTERLKESIYAQENRVDIDGIILLTRIDKCIDNLVKEMTEAEE